MALPSLLLLIVFSAVLRSPAAATNLLLSGNRLSAGESLTSRSGPRLSMQNDCNLVLSGADGRALWATFTSAAGLPSGRCYLTLLPTGQLAVHRTGSLLPLWTSGAAAAHGSYALVLRPDGEIRVYGPAVRPESKLVVAVTMGLVLFPEEVMGAEHVAAAGGKPLWVSGDRDLYRDFVVVAHDTGNMALYQGIILSESGTGMRLA